MEYGYYSTVKKALYSTTCREILNSSLLRRKGFGVVTYTDDPAIKVITTFLSELLSQYGNYNIVVTKIDNNHSTLYDRISGYCSARRGDRVNGIVAISVENDVLPNPIGALLGDFLRVSSFRNKEYIEAGNTAEELLYSLYSFSEKGGEDLVRLITALLLLRGGIKLTKSKNDYYQNGPVYLYTRKARHVYSSTYMYKKYGALFEDTAKEILDRYKLKRVHPFYGSAGYKELFFSTGMTLIRETREG